MSKGKPIMGSKIPTTKLPETAIKFLNRPQLPKTKIIYISIVSSILLITIFISSILILSNIHISISTIDIKHKYISISAMIQSFS